MEESTTSCASGYLFRFHPWWGKVLGWYHLLYRIYRNRSLLVLHPVRVTNVRIDSSGYYASFVATIQQPWMESSSRGTLFCCVRNHNQQPSIHPVRSWWKRKAYLFYSSPCYSDETPCEHFGRAKNEREFEGWVRGWFIWFWRPLRSSCSSQPAVFCWLGWVEHRLGRYLY